MQAVIARSAVAILSLALPSFVLAVDPSSVSFNPHAIFADGVSSSLLEIDVGPASVVVNVEFKRRDTGQPFAHLIAAGNPSPTSTLQLFDNGTNGDVTPGDGVFSVGGITTLFSGLPPEGFVRLYMLVDVDGIVTQLWIPAFGVTEDAGFDYEIAGPSVLSSDYLVNIFGQPLPFRENIVTISQFFYDLFPDEYDFLLLHRERVPGSHGYFFPVRNDVQGIGRTPFDDSQLYGSDGVLRGIVEFGTTDSQFTMVFNTTVFHEFAHNWGASLDDPALPLSDQWHWFNNTTNIGMLNNCCHPFVSNGDGSFTKYCDFFFDHYSPLELYTMGAISGTELDTLVELYILEDPNIFPTTNPHIACGESVVPAVALPVSSTDIEAVYGPRIPTAASSQKNFATASVFVTDRQMTIEEVTVASHILRQYGGRGSAPPSPSIPPSFRDYTGGRLTMEFLLDGDLLFSDGFESGDTSAWSTTSP
jgi:hypothetical protein